MTSRSAPPFLLSSNLHFRLSFFLTRLLARNFLHCCSPGVYSLPPRDFVVGKRDRRSRTPPSVPRIGLLFSLSLSVPPPRFLKISSFFFTPTQQKANKSLRHLDISFNPLAVSDAVYTAPIHIHILLFRPTIPSFVSLSLGCSSPPSRKLSFCIPISEFFQWPRRK